MAGSAFSLYKPLCDNERCGLFLESTARQNIEETKTWKAYALRERGDAYSLFTFYGCCGCEMIPPDDTNAQWRFRRRNLTAVERELFYHEYGQQAPLLLTGGIAIGARIRGFVLNGRRAGWNFSTCLEIKS